ncbi:hypothetical protein BFR69_07545 [Acinetobacter pittii]|uniref:hypothetical protein n=1 Tax=Acinetobacter TaxID=469 RepID=UPI0002E74D3D|nr:MULTISPECIES: hypothetical protein [Acinetobacter]AUT32811.1 hypothetical protein C2U64_02390 [Acinetobacter pittii]AZB91838.1 hypothetical protein DKC15_001215 [Acinetobacter pittii]MBQ5176119.1 hypothetical protein [Acinetobacter pittii]MCE6395986.1 hypothetical protein [Acinetobacter pittii]MDA3493489.1 hypothetical protein [Acinetobacter sp. AOR33_HL]
MNKSDSHFSIGHFSDLIKFNQKTCTAKYRKDTPSTITVHSSTYPIETYYADFYNRSESAINKISPDFLKKKLRKDLNVYTFYELFQKVVRSHNTFVSGVYLLALPTLDPKDKILKNCPIYNFNGNDLSSYMNFQQFVTSSNGIIIVSSLKKGKKLDNALIGLYRLNHKDEIDGLMIVRVLDLEHYNDNHEQILDSNEILGLENFPEFNLECYQRLNYGSEVLDFPIEDQNYTF